MKVRYWLAGGTLAAAGAVLWTMRQTSAAHPRTHLLDLPAEPPLPEEETGTVQYLGTATLLIRYQGLTVLTDPNFLRRGQQAHAGYGLHMTRLTDPALDFDDLPPFDFVLLSHLHEDHFDQLVERRLGRDVPILTTASAARTLRRRGFTNTYALRAWDRVNVRKGLVSLRVTAMPAKHGPVPASALLPDVIGSMLDFRNERDGRHYRIYISGDTLLYRGLRNIPLAYSRIDLALLHLGGARFMGVLVTMDAEQGIEALRLLHPDLTIPVHFNDYDLYREPLETFRRAVDGAGLQHRVRYLYHGESHLFAPHGVVEEARPLA